MNRRKLAMLLAASSLMIGMFGLSAGAVSAEQSIAWTGNGVTDNELDTVNCDENNGAPYIYWVFASSKGLTSPVLHFGGTGTGDYPMNDDNGTWKLQVGPWFDLDGLTAWVTFDGTAENGNPHLTISHGCPGETQTTTSESTTESTSESTTESTSESTTESTTESTSESTTTTFTGGTAGETDVPTQPNTAAVGTGGTSHPSNNAWLLVLALGGLLTSVVLLTPAGAKSKR